MGCLVNYGRNMDAPRWGAFELPKEKQPLSDHDKKLLIKEQLVVLSDMEIVQAKVDKVAVVQRLLKCTTEIQIEQLVRPLKMGKQTLEEFLQGAD